jgi:hypothetical protein
MASKEQLKELIKAKLPEVLTETNKALKGKELARLEPVLTRIGHGAKLPHWYEKLKADKVLPNLDGKSIGSVVEMLLVAVLETLTLKDQKGISLRINPARGVDLPDLDLGIKSPSKNYCTSEAYFSAYERLLGSEYDSLVVLTDYQTAKKNPPLRLQLTDAKFLSGSQLADKVLCAVALKHRSYVQLQNEAWLIKMFKFLAFVNQSDWRAKCLLNLVANMQDPKEVKAIVAAAKVAFKKKNQDLEKKSLIPLPDEELRAITQILKVTPLTLGIIDAADNWVTETQKDAARSPNENELARLRSSPLNGEIGMSFALQWRYNFSKVFKASKSTVKKVSGPDVTDIAELTSKSVG